jgi:hypothetical protein
MSKKHNRANQLPTANSQAKLNNNTLITVSHSTNQLPTAKPSSTTQYTGQSINKPTTNSQAKLNNTTHWSVRQQTNFKQPSQAKQPNTLVSQTTNQLPTAKPS